MEDKARCQHTGQSSRSSVSSLSRWNGDEVEVPVTVKKQSDTFNPTAKEPNQTVRHNEVPDPEKSINTNDLPAGTKL